VRVGVDVRVANLKAHCHDVLLDAGSACPACRSGVRKVADDAAVARRTGIGQDRVCELLKDNEAYGWVTRVEFAGTGGWTLTERGRDEDSRRLTQELARTGARTAVEQAPRF
jgi:hypothetical protein